MSRKKKQTPPVDTGGLNLNIPPAAEPVLDVTAPIEPAWGKPGTTTTDEVGNVWVTVEPVGRPYMHTNGDLDNCVTLFEALQMSVLYLAVRMTNNPNALVISNGRTFWTVDVEKLEPALFDGILYMDAHRTNSVWRPVAGNERGWYVG